MIQENGLTLAYIGDAVYELHVREYLLSTKRTLVNDMHKSAIEFTCATAQSRIIDHLMDNLSDEELDIFKRGRNSSQTHKPKNASGADYRKATGFEALVGYLYLIKNEERLHTILEESVKFIISLRGSQNEIKVLK